MLKTILDICVECQRNIPETEPRFRSAGGYSVVCTDCAHARQKKPVWK